MRSCLKRICQCEFKSRGRCFGYILLLLTVIGIMSTLVYIDLIPDVRTIHVNGTLRHRTTYINRDVMAYVAYGTTSGMGKNLTLHRLGNKTMFSNGITLFQINMNTDNGSPEKNITKTSFNNTSKHLTINFPDQYEIRNNWDSYKPLALKIYILSAIASNFAQQSGYTASVKLNGWQFITHKSIPIKCCVLSSFNNVSEYFHPRRTYQNKRLVLLGTQISCPVKGRLQDVRGVTLQYLRQKCPENRQEYLRPLTPEVPSKNVSMVICLKLLYGKIANMDLIYWIEFYLELGVDKIFMFVYNIGNKTRTILTHYYNLGVLEWRNFNYPIKWLRKIGEKVPVFWEDEQVLVYDAFSRFHGYTYLAIIDLDEYLLPRKHNNLKDMMTNLTKTYPEAAGFTIHSYIFNKKWGVSGTRHGTILEKFVKRTHLFTGIYARRKNILLPKRVLFDNFFHTHTYTPKKGYKRVIVKGSTVAINHYRVCYTSMKKHLCDKNRAITDTEILKVVARITPRTRWFDETGGG